MYNKNNIDILKVCSKGIKPELRCVAFYGNRTVATDSFRLVEMSADGEAHEPVMYSADLLKTVKLKKGETIDQEGIEARGLKPVAATYPEVDYVIKEQTQGDFVEVKLNGRYLAEVATLLSKLNVFEKVTLKVPVDGGVARPGRAIIVEAQGKDDQRTRGIIMPINK